ncbi:hypothetical protein CR513_16694, partial [Mucuna pruriens]
MMHNLGQATRLPIKESLTHLKKFLHFTNKIKMNNVPMDAIYLGGLFTLNRVNIDVACGGTIMKKLTTKAFDIIKDMIFDN